MELKDFKLIIFDLDGVLIDSKIMYLYVLKESIEKFTNRKCSYKEIEPLLGQSVLRVLCYLIPDRKKALEAKKYVDEMCLSERALGMVSLSPYAKEVIEELKRRDHLLAILTNSTRVFVEKVLKRFSIDKYWDIISTADDTFDTKVERAAYSIKLLGATPERTVYIADMVDDIRVARKIGCRIIAIPGWHNEETLKKEGPDRLITSLIELIR